MLKRYNSQEPFFQYYGPKMYHIFVCRYVERSCLDESKMVVPRSSILILYEDTEFSLKEHYVLFSILLILDGELCLETKL